MNKISLASDNNSGVHPAIFEIMQEANTGYAVGYGDDTWTARAQGLFRQEFGEGTEALFVFNGTGANVLAIQTLLKPFEAVICAESAHINEDEAGAPEATAGVKLLTVETEDGKLRPENIAPFMKVKGFVHANQPGMVSISNVTENGTVYSLEELRALTSEAHRHGLWVHLDGARIANAAAALGVSLREATRDVGVDVLSFGGTKNGMLMGEAVVFFGKEKARFAENFRKQNAQLFSKMRFVAAQFIPYFGQKLWQTNAQHANQMAQKLKSLLEPLPQVALAREVEANSVFAILPPESIPAIQEQFFFYVWNDARHEVRLMTSFATEEWELNAFADFLKKTLA